MKIVIVGAGVSGLSAGIFALKAGYEVEIYEKNNVAGGCCSSWKRGDFTIDNCIHWLTGTKKGTPQYNVWKECIKNCLNYHPKTKKKLPVLSNV